LFLYGIFDKIRYNKHIKNTIKQAVSADQNVISELQDKIALLENEKVDLLAKLFWFEERIRLERHRRYGRSSEQTIPEQQSLFNEDETGLQVLHETGRFASSKIQFDETILYNSNRFPNIYMDTN
jgi:hypothetical protein